MSSPAELSGRAVVDAWPVEVTLRPVAGDPFSFRAVLRGDDGQPVDVSAWDFAATLTTGTLRLDFEWAADDTGVRFWLRGEDTARLTPGRPATYDVAARQPTAGEGVMILAGKVEVKGRVTDPLRSDPDTGPREGELVPA
jgi:hypothetical protein